MLWTCRKADCDMDEIQNRSRPLSYEFPPIHNSQTFSTMQYIRDITSINKSPSTVANSRLAAQVIACLLCSGRFITVSTTARHCSPSRYSCIQSASKMYRTYTCLQWTEQTNFNLLEPNDIYIRRTAALTSRRYILYIYSTNIHTEYFKHAA